MASFSAKFFEEFSLSLQVMHGYLLAWQLQYEEYQESDLNLSTIPLSPKRMTFVSYKFLHAPGESLFIFLKNNLK